VKVCVIGKYPPTEGGVSARTYWTCHLLARAGHNMFVVTNASQTEPEHREWLLPGDTGRLAADYPGGGSVRVEFIQPYHDDDLYYIPRGEPTMTRLASVAAQTVRRNRCDLLIGWYLEPYVLAASLVAGWTRRPYLVCHAGSDLQELAAQPELGPAYREAVLASAGVLSATLPAEGIGLPADRVFGFPGPFLAEEFSPSGTVMDLPEMARLIGAAAPFRTEPLPPGTMVIGAYGKLGPTKGTMDLIRAVARARTLGAPVCLALAGGGRRWDAVAAEIVAAGLADATIMLPMLAPWRIPSFIRACRALAFLERDFAVPVHRPIPPLEILACGRPLLLSAELAGDLLPGRIADDPLFDSVELVNPRDADALATAVVSVLSRPAPAPQYVAPSLRTQVEVAGWYAAVFDTVTAVPRPSAGTASADTGRLLREHCPALVALAGQELVECQLATAAAEPNALLAAYSAADALLAATTAAGGAGPAGLAQLAVAEHHALWCRVDVEGRAGLPAFAVPVRREPGLAAVGAEPGALRPVASSWRRVATFDVDVIAHLTAVAARRATLDGALSPLVPAHVLLFHKTPSLSRSISRIGPVIAALLEAADGRATLREHAVVLGLDGERFTRFLAAVAELHRAGIVLFHRDDLADGPS
jgi:glycosyltransferase involved in cell wall biosynthesis